MINQIIKAQTSYGITAKFFDVMCHMILIGSHLEEAARDGDRIRKCRLTESPHFVKLLSILCVMRMIRTLSKNKH